MDTIVVGDVSVMPHGISTSEVT